MSNLKKAVLIVSVGVMVSMATMFGMGYIVGERKQQVNSLKQIKQALDTSDGWRSAAEHYGGICKSLLEGKPIYGNVDVGDNSTLAGCLIVMDGNIEISGQSATVMNCEFVTMHTDWFNSLTAVDPNEYAEVL